MAKWKEVPSLEDLLRLREDGHATLARRLYLHVLNGGQVTAKDMARLVEKIEELEAKLNEEDRG